MELETIPAVGAVVFFVVGYSLLILTAIPETYSFLHLSFLHFTAAVTIVFLSGILALLYYLLSRRLDQQYLRLAETVRSQAVNNPHPKESRHNSPSNEPGTALTDPPTRQQLSCLKEVLGLDAGSLQYKERGDGVYWVKYEHGKHCWVHLGSWESLKGKLES